MQILKLFELKIISNISIPVTRMIGASRWKNVSCSIILAQISDPIPNFPNKNKINGFFSRKNLNKIQQ